MKKFIDDRYYMASNSNKKNMILLSIKECKNRLGTFDERFWSDKGRDMEEGCLAYFVSVGAYALSQSEECRKYRN